MEDGFYSARLRQRFEIEAVIPSAASQQLVHGVIYGELCQGLIRPESRREFQRIIREVADAGAEAVILGCTEIELLISELDSDLPVYASTTMHARAAVDFALQERPSIRADSADV